MKKVFTLIALAIALMTTLSANAQIKFGLKGGLNVTNMSLSTEVLDANNQTGFFVGPTIKVTLPIVGLGVDAAALYDQRDAKLGVDGTQEVVGEKRVSQKSINVPINLRYGLGLGEMASIYLFAGPQFGFNVGEKNVKAIDWKWKDSAFSVNVGAGVTLLSHFEIAANYNIACGKSGEATIGNTIKSGISGKANAWQVSLAYYF